MDRESTKYEIRKAFPNAYLYEFNQFKEEHGSEVYERAEHLIRGYVPSTGKHIGMVGYTDHQGEHLQGIFFYVYNLDGSTSNIWQELPRVEKEIIYKLKVYCMESNLTEWK